MTWEKPLRLHTLDIFSAIVFGLLTVEKVAFHGYTLTGLVVSGIIGFVLGSYDVREVTRGIGKNGEFRRAWKPLLLVAVSAIVLLSLTLYGLMIGIVSITILSSAFAFAPTMFLGRFVFSWRWEERNHKEIQSEGSWRATLYAIPKGLTSDEKFKIRWDMQQRLRQRSH